MSRRRQLVLLALVDRVRRSRSRRAGLGRQRSVLAQGQAGLAHAVAQAAARGRGRGGRPGRRGAPEHRVPGRTRSRGVSAAGCIVAPYGCTANFIFSDGASYYVGTAGHCSNSVGRDRHDAGGHDDARGRRHRRQADDRTPLATASRAPTSRSSGSIRRSWRSGGSARRSRSSAGRAASTRGCGPDTVRHYGHGYVAAVAQGKPSAGLATNWCGQRLRLDGLRPARRLGQPGGEHARPGGRQLHPPDRAHRLPRQQPGGHADHVDPRLRRRVARERGRQQDVGPDVGELRHRTRSSRHVGSGR